MIGNSFVQVLPEISLRELHEQMLFLSKYGHVSVNEFWSMPFFERKELIEILSEWRKKEIESEMDYKQKRDVWFLKNIARVLGARV